MKKISFLNTLYRRSVLCLILLMSTCMVCLTSCSDDDEESGGEGIGAGAPYTGVWVMTHIKIVEDGKTEEGAVTPESGVECKLTLLENGNYTYYALTKGDTDDEDELIEESGQWSFSGNKLTLTNDLYISKMTVYTWTATKLVTYQEEEGDSETRTWEKQ